MKNSVLERYKKTSSFSGGNRTTVPVRILEVLDLQNVVFTAQVLHDCELAQAGEVLQVESNKQKTKFANNKSIFYEKSQQGSVGTDLILTNSYRDGDKIIGGYFYLGSVGAKRSIEGDPNSTYSLDAGLMSELTIKINNAFRADGEPEAIRWPLNKKSIVAYNGKELMKYSLPWMLSKVAQLNSAGLAGRNISAYYTLAMLDKVFVVNSTAHLEKAALNAFRAKMNLGVRVGDLISGDYWFTTFMYDYKAKNVQENLAKVWSKPIFSDLDLSNNDIKRIIFDEKGRGLPSGDGKEVLVVEAFPVKTMRYDPKGRSIEALIKKLSDSAPTGEFRTSSGFTETEKYCMAVAKVSNRETRQGEKYKVALSAPFRTFSVGYSAIGDFVTESFIPDVQIRNNRIKSNIDKKEVKSFEQGQAPLGGGTGFNPQQGQAPLGGGTGFNS